MLKEREQLTIIRDPGGALKVEGSTANNSEPLND